MAGYHKVFVMTPAVHAQMLFVAAFQDRWIPTWLLWLLGTTIPFVELVAGGLLLAGWLRRPTAVVLGFLLVTVTYGHTLEEPFYNVTTHVLARLLLLAPSLVLHVGDDPWSIDAWIAVRRARRDLG